MHAVIVNAVGGPEALEWREVDDPEPGQRELIVAPVAVGVNFIDTYHRSGLYSMPLPFTPGMEGAGTVVAVGAACVRFVVGDRVAWTTVPGSYAERVRVPEESAVAVPADVDLEVAAAAMVQGLTAHYLVTDTFPLAAGHRCLVHAAAGGVGLLLVQLAKHIGAQVFATVGTPAKAVLATAAGADHVVLYRDEDFGTAIERVAGAHALDVVYDGVGRAVFERSLDLLRPRGMMVTFGNASGPADPVSPLRLMQGGSLFLTRPNLTHYVASRAELERRSADVFSWIGSGRLDVKVGERLPLRSAAEAHRLLESRGTVGKVLLVPGPA